MREESETTETLAAPIQDEGFRAVKDGAPSDGVYLGQVRNKIAPSVLDSSLLSDQEKVDLSDQEQLDPRATENKNIPIQFPLPSDEEEVDPITKAVRVRIIAEQWRIIAEHLGEDQLKKARYRKKFFEDEKNKQQVSDLFKNPQFKDELEKIEIEGYKYVFTNFEEKWKEITWQEGQTIIKDPETKKDIITLQSLESPPPPMRVKRSDGTEVTIHKYRKIEGIPLKLNPENISGPVILSFDLRDQDGKYLGDSSPLRVTIHYNASTGKPMEFSSPEPMLFENQGPNAIGYIEHGGKMISTGIDQKTYKALRQEIAKNRDHVVDISQVVEAPAIEQKQQPLDLVSSSGTKKTFPNLQDMGNDLNSKPAVTPEELARILRDMGVGFPNKTVNPNANAGKSTKAMLSTRSDMGGPPAGVSTVLAYLNRGTQTEGELIKETLDSLPPEQQAQMREKLVELKHLSPVGDQDVSTGVANYGSLKKQYLLQEKQTTITNLPDNKQDLMNKDTPNRSADNQIDPHIDKTPGPKSAEPSSGKDANNALSAIIPPQEYLPPVDAHQTSMQEAAHLRAQLQHPSSSPSPVNKKPPIPEIPEKDLKDRAQALYAQLESAEKPGDYKTLIQDAMSQLNKENVSPKQQLEYLNQLTEKTVEDRQKTVEEINRKIKEGTHPLTREHPGAVELRTETRAVDADDGFPTVIRTQQNTQVQVGKVGGIKLQTVISNAIQEVREEIRKQDATKPNSLPLTPKNHTHLGRPKTGGGVSI